MPQFEFFTAKEIDEEMRGRIGNYIEEFVNKEVQELVDRDWQSDSLICPICRVYYPDYSFFLKHFRFYKHRWELRLLDRIREHGPKNLQVFDVFYDDINTRLRAQVRFWVLCVKIHEGLNMLPAWKNWRDGTMDYVKKLFWNYDRKAKKEV
jgi:hypothetical protein